MHQPTAASPTRHRPRPHPGHRRDDPRPARRRPAGTSVRRRLGRTRRSAAGGRPAAPRRSAARRPSALGPASAMSTPSSGSTGGRPGPRTTRIVNRPASSACPACSGAGRQLIRTARAVGARGDVEHRGGRHPLQLRGQPGQVGGLAQRVPQPLRGAFVIPGPAARRPRPGATGRPRRGGAAPLPGRSPPPARPAAPPPAAAASSRPLGEQPGDRGERVGPAAGLGQHADREPAGLGRGQPGAGEQPVQRARAGAVGPLVRGPVRAGGTG